MRSWTEKSLSLFTLLLAVGTFWLGWETRQLKMVDLGPHINIVDVLLEELDDTGSILKCRSWLQGESCNPNASKKPITKISVQVKFSNSGKQAGYVELLNYSEILKKVSSSGIAPEGLLGGRVLVPGEGETGWSYGVDITNAFDKNVILDLPYEFIAYDINGEKNVNRKVAVRCDFPEVDPGFINATCKPIYLQPEKTP